MADPAMTFSERAVEAAAEAISPALIRERFTCDPDTGIVIWKSRPRSDFPDNHTFKRWNNMFSGKEAGWTNNDGYLQARINRRTVKLHRIAWCIYHGNWPKGEVDHINGDRTDNRQINLRDASHIENGKNRGISKNNTSGCTGVVWNAKRKKWIAQIRQNKKNIILGAFSSFEEAKDARTQCEREHGFHPLNGARLAFAPPLTAASDGEVG